MNTPVFSDGDFLGAKRLGFARDLQARGDSEYARAVIESVTADWPEWAAGWMALGKAAAEGRDISAAAAAFRKVLALDSTDHFGAALHLAKIGATDAPAAPPPAFIAALFDEYAPKFEKSLIGKLDYAAPKVLSELVRSATGERLNRTLDLGCGTGLMADHLHLFASRFEGIDLSAQMTEIAGRKGIYDHLETAEIGDSLAGRGAASVDTVLAADVFVYIGALGPVFEGIARVLRPGGLFAFTVEHSLDAPDWTLRDSLRYAHSQPYIRAALETSGFGSIEISRALLRMDKGLPLEGLYVLARRASVIPLAPAVSIPDGIIPVTILPDGLPEDIRPN